MSKKWIIIGVVVLGAGYLFIKYGYKLRGPEGVATT